jgi:hypothetical protein
MNRGNDGSIVSNIYREVPVVLQELSFCLEVVSKAGHGGLAGIDRDDELAHARGISSLVLSKTWTDPAATR